MQIIATIISAGILAGICILCFKIIAGVLAWADRQRRDR